MKPSYPITLPALLVPASTELETPVRLNKYPVLLGRSESADIRLDDRWLSRNHCEIDVTDGELIIRDLEGSTQKRNLKIKQRKFKIQRIDGLPKKFVSPPSHILSRIREENNKIKKVRLFDRDEVFFRSGFIMPAEGRISGVYGSQRILNGQPRQPHFGIDIAAPSGATVSYTHLTLPTKRIV